MRPGRALRGDGRLTGRVAGHPPSVLDDAAVLLSRASRGGLAWAVPALALQGRRAVRTMGGAWAADALALLLSKAVRSERPCREGESLVPCPESSSFPSNHAATAAAAAFLIGDDVPQLRPVLALGAGAVAASRVRVGVHRTRDVLAGLALGAAVAAVVRSERAAGAARRSATWAACRGGGSRAASLPP